MSNTNRLQRYEVSGFGISKSDTGEFCLSNDVTELELSIAVSDLNKYKTMWNQLKDYIDHSGPYVEKAFANIIKEFDS